MTTVTALLDLRIKPESVAKAKETVESVLVATRAFPGCLGVDVPHAIHCRLGRKDGYEAGEARRCGCRASSRPSVTATPT